MLRLIEERTRRGWSRAELGRRARLHPADIGKIEAGRLMAYPSQLRKLARAFGLPATDARCLLDDAEALPLSHDDQRDAAVDAESGRGCHRCHVAGTAQS